MCGGGGDEDPECGLVTVRPMIEWCESLRHGVRTPELGRTLALKQLFLQINKWPRPNQNSISQKGIFHDFIPISNLSNNNN